MKNLSDIRHRICPPIGFIEPTNPIQSLDNKKIDNETKSKAISKPTDLTQDEYVVIFKEIVRRMVEREVSDDMILLQEQKLIDAVIYFENEINKGKNSQGELVHFKFDEYFQKLIMKS